MPALSLRLPEDLDQRLEDEARLERLPRSEVVRIAIVDYLTRRERERFMAELVAEADTAYADESIRHAALEMAEEGMATSNEALDKVEVREIRCPFRHADRKVVEMMRRGEIWAANLNPGRGREIGKIRPVLVIQDNALTVSSTPMVVILPLTTQIYPALKKWRIMIEPRDRLLKQCQVVVDQPRALDKDRFGDGPLTSLTMEEIAAVEHSLKGVLGLL